MKKCDDKKVFDTLRQQIKAERDYNEKFLAARRLVKQRDEERVSQYDKFKSEQKRNNEANEMLTKFLSSKK